MSLLNEIGLKHGTDKASKIHDYLNKYNKYLPFDRPQELKILEIGVLDGASARTWKEYYYKSQIIGIDINPDCKKHEEEKITIEIGSQTDGEFLKRVVDKHGPFDMILDDGSHINSHVIYSFEQLWKSVKSKGVYVVEDASTSYWEDYGGKNRTAGTIIEYFKNIIDDVNFYGELIEDRPIIHARRDDHLLEQFKIKGYEYNGIHAESINFLNSIIIITKR
jgi:predicted O-methyltransferase YrrM